MLITVSYIILILAIITSIILNSIFIYKAWTEDDLIKDKVINTLSIIFSFCFETVLIIATAHYSIEKFLM